LVSCGNVNCSCLELLKEDDGVHAVVAKYLTGFERKKLRDQDSFILDWYRFAEAMRIGRRQYGTACRTMELGAWTWGVSSMQHELISCVQRDCLRC
jgi:hypothetical protein